MTDTLSNILNQIKAAVLNSATISCERARAFFKTSSGNYAEHDEFVGVTVPNLRKLAKIFGNCDLSILRQLLHSRINEERLLALFILITRYQKADKTSKQDLYQFYLDNLQHINNWNLVDASAHLILGAHIWNNDRTILIRLAQSDILWERRIAVVATLYFIRNGELEWVFKLASLLLNDKHDLVHKATGWMLREAGKRDVCALVEFLDKNAHNMPRTMLRYAIERFAAKKRRGYLIMKAC